MDFREKPWNKNLQMLLALTIAFNLLPHLFNVPIWVSLYGFCAVAWKVLYLTRGLSLPRKLPLSIGALTATAAVLVHIPLPFNQRTAAAMLVIIATSKLLESNRYRDAMLAIIGSYFLLLIQLLNAPTLGTTIFMIVDLLWLTVLMLQMHWDDERVSIRRILPPLKTVLWALPLWLLLFVAFPRFTVGGLKARQNTAETGFTDKLNPGAVGRLVDSPETVFRAQFQDIEKFPPESFYWRGASLAFSNGISWARGVDGNSTRGEVIRPGGFMLRPFSYEIWMEPGYQKWLFTIEYTGKLTATEHEFPGVIYKINGMAFEASSPSYNRFVYRGVANWSAPKMEMSTDELRPYLQLPRGIDDNVVQLAQELKSDGDEKFSSMAEPELRYNHRLLDWFVEKKFRYSKNPEALASPSGVGQLSEFLFQKRRGFCEHYAATYATLMRLMGVPARVVVGFQGGVSNDVGKYLIVRKMDAHAWAEIWVKDGEDPNVGRWIRVDPTTRIAPLRLQMGGDFYRVDPRELAEGLTKDELQKLMDTAASRVFRRVRYTWDLMQMQWNMFLLRYNLSFQSDLLKQLGYEGSAIALLGAVVGVGFLGFLGFVTFIFWRRSKREDKLVLAWRKFCARFEKAGLRRNPNEGPLQFATRAAELKPEKSAEIHSIAFRFAQARYGANPTPAELRRLKSDLRRFSA